MKAEHLRLLIGQDIGLLHLIPLAIKVLKKDILAAGDLYPGSLLKNVVKCSPAYWKNNPAKKKAMLALLKEKKNHLKKLDKMEDVKRSVGAALDKFLAGN